MDGDGGVGDQRPGRGGPHEQRCSGRPVAARERAGRQRHPDVDRGIGDGLVDVGLAQLVVGQRRPAPRTVRTDAVVAYQQALVEDGPQRPPDALDVRRVHRAVGLGHVDPVAHPFGHLGERVDVPLDRGAAGGVEARDAVLLDLPLAGDPQLLLDGDLDGQAVAVPAGLALDVPSPHRLEAREEVLEDPRLDVVRAGPAVGGRRALVERPRCGAGGLGEAFVEDAVFVPEREDLPIEGGQVDLRVHGGIGAVVGTGHRCLPVVASPGTRGSRWASRHLRVALGGRAGAAARPVVRTLHTVLGGHVEADRGSGQAGRSPHRGRRVP